MTTWDCDAIFRLYEQLLHVWSSGAARSFLTTPHKELNGRRPCELIESAQGYKRVCELIDRLERGTD